MEDKICFELIVLCLLQCVKPVLAVIHGACIGGGIDMISSCDIRIATKEAFFQVKVGGRCDVCL